MENRIGSGRLGHRNIPLDRRPRNVPRRHFSGGGENHLTEPPNTSRNVSNWRAQSVQRIPNQGWNHFNYVPAPLANEMHPNALLRNHVPYVNVPQNLQRGNQIHGQPGAYQAQHLRNPQLRDSANQRRGNYETQNQRNQNDGNRAESDGQQEGSSNNRRRNDRKFRMGFKLLEAWSDKEPDEIIVLLVSQKVGFEELLESELSGNYMVLVLKVLAKLCLSPFSVNKADLMTLALKDKFITTLKTYIMQLQLQERYERKRNIYFWSDVNGFFNNLMVVFESIIQSVPTRACEVLPKMLKALTLTIPNFEEEQQTKVSDEIKEKLKKIQEKLDLCKTEVKRKKKAAPQHPEDEEAPPDDFRTLSVYPTSQEILSSERPFIRRHIIKGAYDDVDHYLDVQFRLLKEDFVAPLREGLNEFMHQQGTKHRISNVRVYPDVRFLCPRFGRDQVGVLLQFDFRPKKETTKNFKYSKRFMYGSLVCFTRDNFATMIFGKIIERDLNLLEQGQVVIGFEPGYDTYELNQPYLMIECSVYFEPYYHVLRALQNMYEDGFPMKNYLIDVNPRIEMPNYLNQTVVYDLKEYSVPLFVPGSWPSASDLQLDNTQYSAFKAALTQQFAVIQGPPGTGKTYLGLEVAKTLIKNGRHWYNRTPILVVCFTNHALDQFLEGLIDTTNDIVRVGGQSQNPKLGKFNLREKRKTVHNTRGINSALYNLRCELSRQLSDIKEWNDSLDEIQRYRSIVGFRHFNNVDPDFASSWFATASDNAIVEWLFGGRTREMQLQEVRNARLEEMQKDLEDEDAANREVDRELDEVWQTENRAQNKIEEDDLLVLLGVRSTKPTYLTSILQMINHINEIRKESEKLSDDIQEQAVYNKKWELDRKLYEMQDDLRYLQFRLEEGSRLKVTRKPADVDLRHPQNMAPNDRWRLYFYWLQLYQASLITKMVDLQTEYREKYRQYIEIKDIDDTEIMKQMLVVGMTTTGAARLQTTLQALQSRIVIVEEAAEVLESHIIVSLTNHCEHLILIGDHQQLRPSTANFVTEREYNLGISLFERMVRNDIQCHVLGVQHRMRPEIAKLIVPNIYPVLENHSSVLNLPQILGIDPCMYFIDHEYPEQESGDSSKLNTHEAEFLIRLARYLIQNGYQPEDITILAAYSGQMFALWRERKKYDLLLQDVRITVLDNYQGEESKIILLSLVRNNSDNQIGFLKIENRVCVALSRAKEGFYMMGNMDLLCRNSKIWPKIKVSLESQEFYGKSLTLRCQIHREEATRVQSAKNFNKVPEGGCRKVCGIQMNCGHKCASICHIIDRAHETRTCKAPCPKILCEENHQCPKLCYEECGPCVVPMKRTLPCNHEHAIPCYMDLKDYKCQTFVTAILPCGHTVTNKPCHQNAATWKCPLPCDTRVEPCGHACAFSCHIKNDPDHLQYKCYKPCAKTRAGCSTGEHACPKSCFEECPPCLIVVQKTRTVCPHRFNVECSVNVDNADCPKPCKNLLPCGHLCKRKCYEQCGNCREQVNKVLPECGHVVKAKCCEEPNRKNCKGQCPFQLRCGHPCKNKCNEPCTTQCNELVDNTKPADCGHKFKISCYLQNQELPSNSQQLLNFCQQPCLTQLACKHFCTGTCGKCMQGRIHETCKEKCGVPLICGHECPIPCRETCQPCAQKCSYRCKHSICRKKCGDPCTNCKENCGRRCRHVQCTAKCGDICTVPPCSEPCQKVLFCGHQCVGFCGDPCPPLCRICNKEELTEIFLGFEDKEDARFLVLDECKHVIESQGMDGWLQQGGNAINYKSCPKCKTPLSSTQRYSDYIKGAIKDVIAVKKRFFGNPKENEKKRTELLGKLEKFQENCGELCDYSNLLEKLLRDFEIFLSPVRGNKRQPLNMLVAQTYTAKIQIVENLVDTFNEAKLKNVDTMEKAAGHVDFIVKVLLQEEQRITNQEIADIQREQKRFDRIMQLCQLEDCEKLRVLLRGRADIKQLLQQVNDLAFSIEVYTERADANLKQKLLDLSKALEAGIGITDKERQEIVRAIGMGPGHWYKCPNGHPYVITECGGATQIGKCNACGEQIGGSGHRLLPTNRHAGEMDGSGYAAWSETANNMFNFEEFRNQLL